MKFVNTKERNQVTKLHIHVYLCLEKKNMEMANNATCYIHYFFFPVWFCYLCRELKKLSNNDNS